MKKVILILASFVLGSVFSMAQELNCSLTINTDNINSTTSKDLYKELESTLNDFLNTHKWSDAVFQKEEKIDITFTIHLDASSQASGGSQSGTLSMSASRPVYNTSYISPLFNYQDKKLQFNYSSGYPIDFSDEYDSGQNLMAVLAFYVNVILGIEFDSFSPLGGTTFFEKAEYISAGARGSEDEGWKALSSDDNRYTLISSYMDANLANLRNVYYEYHRLGFDVMADDVNKGKAKIMEQMTYLKEMQRSKPYALPLQIFVNTKFDELYNLYHLDDQKVRDEVYNAISSIAPNMKDLEKLQKGN